MESILPVPLHFTGILLVLVWSWATYFSFCEKQFVYYHSLRSLWWQQQRTHRAHLGKQELAWTPGGAHTLKGAAEFPAWNRWEWGRWRAGDRGQSHSVTKQWRWNDSSPPVPPSSWPLLGARNSERIIHKERPSLGSFPDRSKGHFDY